MATSLLQLRQGIWMCAWVVGLIGPVTAFAHAVAPASERAVERTHRAASMRADATRTMSVERQARELTMLTPVSFAEAAAPVRSASELVAAQHEPSADTTSGPRTASTVASTLALFLFFFLRRVQ